MSASPKTIEETASVQVYVRGATWKRLNARKASAGESFDDVITALLDHAEDSR